MTIGGGKNDDWRRKEGRERRGGGIEGNDEELEKCNIER